MYRPVILWLLLCSSVAAHDMTPTYPEWKMSLIPTAKITTMQIFNKRQDVQWYEIKVFDEKWNSLPFFTRNKILNVKYLSRKKFDVYMRNDYSEWAKYICSTSKLRGNDSFEPIVESRICSRLK